MIKKFIIVCLVVFIGIYASILTAPAQAGAVVCLTYQCRQAQQEIQYLYDAIWRESEKLYPNYAAMDQAQERINRLNNIR